VVHGFDPYYPQYYEGRSEDAAYREYFESILENLHTDADFDVYGHLDYVVRYGPHKNRFYSYKKHSDVIDEILRTLIDRGKGIELNTAGFKYGLGHPNPTEEILARYRELGGEILTIGSDAHAPEHVAYAFEQVPEILKKSGFRYYTVFSARKPSFLSLY
jgi:histidinol-phosphatase (PHP family)